MGFYLIINTYFWFKIPLNSTVDLHRSVLHWKRKAIINFGWLFLSSRFFWLQRLFVLLAVFFIGASGITYGKVINIGLVSSLAIFMMDTRQFTPLNFLSITLIAIFNKFFLDILLVFSQWISNWAHIFPHIGILAYRA